MKRFEPSEQESERLRDFHNAVFEALVPASGEATSVQGELVRAVARLYSDCLREGMGNYYEGMGDAGEAARVEDTYLGRLMVFLLDTLIENRNRALDNEDTTYFSDIRGLLSSDWLRRKRLSRLENKYNESESTPAEEKELEELEAAERIAWEEALQRAERCIANWCLANPELTDREGRPVAVRGNHNVNAIFEPAPPAPPPCPICKGKGWVPPKDATHFPEICSCKKT